MQKLSELVEKWRFTMQNIEGNEALIAAVEICAQELESLLPAIEAEHSANVAAVRLEEAEHWFSHRWPIVSYQRVIENPKKFVSECFDDAMRISTLRAAVPAVPPKEIK